MEAPELTASEWAAQTWEGGGFMMWPLAAAFIIGMIVVVWKLVDLTSKGARTRKTLRTVDGLVAEGRAPETPA